MPEETKERSLTREVQAVQIPSGESIELPALTKVRITQQLGGSYTVMTPTVWRGSMEQTRTLWVLISLKSNHPLPSKRKANRLPMGKSQTKKRFGSS